MSPTEVLSAIFDYVSTHIQPSSIVFAAGTSIWRSIFRPIPITLLWKDSTPASECTVVIGGASFAVNDNGNVNVPRRYLGMSASVRYHEMREVHVFTVPSEGKTFRMKKEQD